MVVLRIGLALAALLLGTAAASTTEADWTFQARLEPDPAVGVRATLRVEATGSTPSGAQLELQVPSWVEVEEPRIWRIVAEDGPAPSHAWNVTATRAGFWHAGLAEVDARGDRWAIEDCCLFAWSVEGRGIASSTADGAIPGELAVGFHPTFRALDAGRAEMVVSVTPQDKRFVGQELVLEVPHGSGLVQRAPADGWHDFAHAFDLRDGERATLKPAAYVWVAYEQGEHVVPAPRGVQRVGCAEIDVVRQGDEVREVGRRGCGAAATDGARPVPGVGASLVALLLGCAGVKAKWSGPLAGRA